MNKIEIPRVNETMYHEKLDNGLDVFLYPKKEVEKTFTIFATKYGSIDQTFTPLGKTDKVTVPDGIAHFLEHKMFEKEDGDVFQYFSERGASANAFTSFTQTAYLFSSTNSEEDNVETLLNFVQDPYFTEQTVEKEKGIIEQEIKMYDDQADWRLFFGTIGSLYENHPVRIDIAGTVDSIYKITHEDLYTCYETFYHPSNMSIFVVGNFDLDSMANLIRENQQQKSFEKPNGIDRFYGDEKDTVYKSVEKIKMPVSTPKCMVAVKEKQDQLDKDHILKNELVRDMILDLYFSKSGSYYEELYQQGLVIDKLRIELYLEESFGFTAIGGSTTKPEQFGERVKEMFMSIKTGNIDQDDFERARNKKYGELIREFNELEGTANTFIHFHHLGIDYRDVFDVLERITLDEVSQIVDEWIDEDRMTMFMILPEDE
ncbi:EF-P 5-aminopentanol modification-associated protein YfmH [Tenuibacillus multivorans]|uniref:Predicted Zn-dependent peptidase n=1 Tax=Tenuibacillus multivorans TaxID=237069 RepID=A0A1G9XVJ2_9BACI|nr:pitrilysin family protein [Tenuibacillus multivorans]GEL75813.1 putative zinc protease YmfH [Tenuibacillus multivorans]SDN00185.1 Predicted Zn-dependent peptidase [Tenuibacillus multivorans]